MYPQDIITVADSRSAYGYAVTVDVFRRFHRGSFRLFLHFGFDDELKRLVKSELNGRWSQTHKGWYIDDTPEMINKIKAVCKGRAWYNLRDINRHLDAESLTLFRSGTAPEKQSSTAVPQSMGVNQADYDAFVRFLKSRGYSSSTIGTYSGMIARLARFYPNKLMSALDAEQIQRFLSESLYDKHVSNSYHRQMIGALKLFYRDQQEADFELIANLVYPQKHRQLPNVISEADVLRILQVTKNLKHRLAFALLYSCGLRIGELLRLKVADIDVGRRTVFVRKSKGFKDRVVMLAESIIPLLNNYLQTYAPVAYLLNGQSKLMYSANSVRKSLDAARLEAGITKRVTPHTLRHSFATHLLEQGVDIRHIQVLLGHSKPETTMLYTYVANDRILQISSPLDHIVSKQTSGILPQIELLKTDE
jgi:site-specific recombinase XerD